MNNPLSAGPTLDSLDQQPDDTTDNEPQNTEQKPLDETLTWHCPYCEYTHSDLGTVRDHITETIEGDHEGISGWSPTADLIATNKDGDEVRRIEGTGKRPDEDHHLDRGDKKKLIINAWLELDKERDLDAITSIIPVSKEYTRRITKQLEDGEITPDDYRKEMDWDVRNELEERLEQYYETHSGTTTTAQMSLTATDDELERGAKKKQIINAYLLDPDVSPSDLEDIFNSSYEYIRREIKKLKDGDIDQEEIEDARDEDLQEQIREELENIGVVVGEPSDEGTPQTESPEETEAEEQPTYMETLEAATKKSRVLNSVLLSRDLDEDIHYTDIADVAHCSDEYARRTVKEIRDGDITDDELQDARDNELMDALQQYYQDNDVVSVGPSGTGKTLDTIEIDLDADDPFENTDASKREVLVNIFLFRPDMSKADAADLAGASSEYARQTYNGIQDGEYDPEEYQNEAIQNALTELEENGELAAFLGEKEEEAEEVAEEREETGPEPEPESEVEAETETPTEEVEAPEPEPVEGEEMIPASEVREVREIAEMLYRQAQYEGENKKAEFIAKELRDRLDKTLEQTPA